MFVYLVLILNRYKENGFQNYEPNINYKQTNKKLLKIILWKIFFVRFPFHPLLYHIKSILLLRFSAQTRLSLRKITMKLLHNSSLVITLMIFLVILSCLLLFLLWKIVLNQVKRMDIHWRVMQLIMMKRLGQ